MTVFNTKHLYRFIRKRDNRYVIRKNNKHYGTFHKVENAMLERDLLEDVDWNTEALINLPSVVYNRYLEWDLPPFPVSPRNDRYGLPKYVTRGGGGRFRVQKLLGGKVYSFGSYRTVEDAVRARDELIKCGWKREDDVDVSK